MISVAAALRVGCDWKARPLRGTRYGKARPWLRINYGGELDEFLASKGEAVATGRSLAKCAGMDSTSGAKAT